MHEHYDRRVLGCVTFRFISVSPSLRYSYTPARCFLLLLFVFSCLVTFRISSLSIAIKLSARRAMPLNVYVVSSDVHLCFTIRN